MADLVSITAVPYDNPIYPTGSNNPSPQDTFAQVTARYSDNRTYDVSFDCTCTSSNPSVVEVINRNVLIGKSPGTVTITVQYRDPYTFQSKSTTISLTVKSPPPVTSISATINSPEVRKGTTGQITVTGRKRDGTGDMDLTALATYTVFEARQKEFITVGPGGVVYAQTPQPRETVRIDVTYEGYQTTVYATCVTNIDRIEFKQPTIRFTSPSQISMSTIRVIRSDGTVEEIVNGINDVDINRPWYKDKITSFGILPHGIAFFVDNNDPNVEERTWAYTSRIFPVWPGTGEMTCVLDYEGETFYATAEVINPDVVDPLRRFQIKPNTNPASVDYYVERSETYDFASPIVIQNWGKETNFDDDVPDVMKDYYYRAKARNSEGKETPWSNTINKPMIVDPTPLTLIEIDPMPFTSPRATYDPVENKYTFTVTFVFNEDVMWIERNRIGLFGGPSGAPSSGVVTNTQIQGNRVTVTGWVWGNTEVFSASISDWTVKGVNGKKLSRYDLLIYDSGRKETFRDSGPMGFFVADFR